MGILLLSMENKIKAIEYFKNLKEKPEFRCYIEEELFKLDW